MRLSSSALRASWTAKPVPYTLSPCPLPYKQPQYYGEWAAASPSPHQGIVQENSSWCWSNQDQQRADNLMVQAVTGQSSSIWAYILYKKINI